MGIPNFNTYPCEEKYPVLGEEEALQGITKYFGLPLLLI